MSDDDEVFDELARRAGAALRRPAPEDGMSVIVAPAATPASTQGDRCRRGWVGNADRRCVGRLQSRRRRQLAPVDSSPATLPATTVDAVPDTLPATTVEPVPETLPATTVEAVPDTLAAMWPQSSIDEVRQAQSSPTPATPPTPGRSIRG